VRIILW